MRVAIKGSPPTKMPMGTKDTYLGSWWEAFGCTWGGTRTKRDGMPVRCGHKHRTKEAADKCRKRMKRERPGNCQDYRTTEVHIVSRQK